MKIAVLLVMLFVLAAPVDARAWSNEIGPAGHEAADSEVLELSEEHVGRLAETRMNVSIVMHYLSSAWSRLQVEGMRSVFNQHGVGITSITGARFELNQHLLDLERALDMNPDGVISMVVNETLEAPAYRKFHRNGTRLVLLDLLPRGFSHPDDYACLISSTNRLNGAMAADIMAEHLPDGGTVGILEFAFPHFVTNQRVIGFIRRLEDAYPDIRVVARAGFGGDTVTMEEAYQRSEEMLLANPGLDGIFAIWIEPAMAATRAARDLGLTPDDLVITTSDLEYEGALEIARGGFIKGTGAQLPYLQGKAAAQAAILAVLGEKLPPFVAIPGIPVTRSNIIEAYETVFRRHPPQKLVQARSRADGTE